MLLFKLELLKFISLLLFDVTNEGKWILLLINLDAFLFCLFVFILFVSLILLLLIFM